MSEGVTLAVGVTTWVVLAIALGWAIWHRLHPWPHWHESADGERLMHRHSRGRRTHAHPTWVERYEAWWDRRFPVK